LTLKTHFASSSEPLKEGSTVPAWCGEQVPEVFFVLVIEGDFPANYSQLIEQIPSRIGTCQKCLGKLAFKYFAPNGYFYAIRTRAGDKAA
jgi:hypothetical protein